MESRLDSDNYAKKRKTSASDAIPDSTSPSIPTTSRKSPEKGSSSAESNAAPMLRPHTPAKLPLQRLRDPGPSNKVKQISEAESSAAGHRPRSSMPLPDFLKYKPQLFWPQEVGALSAKKPVQTDVIEENPSFAFQKDWVPVARSLKSEIYPGIFRTNNSCDEYVAVKVIACDDDTVEKVKAAKEFRTLLGIEHNHIIRTIGSFVDNRNRFDKKFGILLYPLAETNFEDHLVEISTHNQDHDTFHSGLRHPDTERLLAFLPCLCRTVLALHQKAIRHSDIKPGNILISHGIVILADFDIAKQYTAREFAHTKSVLESFTRRYAPKHVQEGKRRGLEWDVYALGCVFLELANVIMGETNRNFLRHLVHGNASSSQDWERQTIDYWQALSKGHVDSWIEHLKHGCRGAPMDRFSSEKAINKYGSSEKALDAFFESIKRMLNATSADEHILEDVLHCFDCLTEQDCIHCHPKFGEFANGNIRPLPSMFSQPFDAISELPGTESACAASEASTIDGEEIMPGSDRQAQQISIPVPARYQLNGPQLNDREAVSKPGPGNIPDIYVTKGTADEANNPVVGNGQATGAAPFLTEAHRLSSEPDEIDTYEHVGIPDLTSISQTPRKPSPGQSDTATPANDEEIQGVPPHPSKPAPGLRASALRNPKSRCGSIMRSRLYFIREAQRVSRRPRRSETLKGMRIVEYCPNKRTFELLKPSDVKSGIIYDLTWLSSPTLILPTGDRLKLRRALPTKHHALRFMGALKQLYVSGSFDENEVHRCAGDDHQVTVKYIEDLNRSDIPEHSHG